MPRIARPTRHLPIKELQLAQLVDEAPEGPEWLHEQKFDGYRILAVVKRGRNVQLLSRRFKDWTNEFPNVVEAVAALPCNRAILDGEVAIVLPDGRTSFQGLQNVLGVANPNLVYFVFDLLALDDEDLMSLPLEERKARLEKLVKPKRGAKPGVIRYSDHVVGNGKKFFELACERASKASSRSAATSRICRAAARRGRRRSACCARSS